MEKRKVVVSTCYARKDIDGTILGFTIGVKEINSKSDYTYRFDYGPATMEKKFGFKDESRCNSLVGKELYLVRSLELN